MSAAPELAEPILAAVEELWTGPIHELRVFDTARGTVRGYFDAPATLAAAAAEWDASPHRGTAPGIYWTLNPAKKECLLRGKNRVKDYAKRGESTQDQDIEQRHWLPIDIDIDPVFRPAGISSTDEERGWTKATALAIGKWLLHDMGVPLTAIGQGDSGNGRHVLVRVDLPNDAGCLDLIRRCLYAIDQKFSDGKAKIDVSTHNASQLWKLYGTHVRKGEDDPERPHRTARLIQAPDVWTPCDKDVLERIAALYVLPGKATAAKISRPDFSSNGANKAYDVQALVDRRFRHVLREGPLPWRDGCTVWLLNECPFNPAHGKHGEVLIGQQPSGAVWFECKHNSCQGYSWADVRAIYDPIPEPTPLPVRQPPASSGNADTKHTSQIPQNRPKAMPGAAQGSHPAPEREVAIDRVFSLSDLGNAERLIHLHGADIRYTAAWKTWHVWDGTRWRRDVTDAVHRHAITTVRRSGREEVKHFATEKQKESAWKHFQASENGGKLEQMVKIAGRLPQLAMHPDDWDANPLLFNAANITFDLHAGVVRRPLREDLMTFATPVAFDPKAQCPTWSRVTEEWMAGDVTKTAFLQEFFATCLSGLTSDQKLLLIYGEGGNGKGVFLETLAHLFGDYAARVRPGTVSIKGQSRVGDDVAVLLGKRLVSAVETRADMRLDENLIKQWTGGDSVTVRHLYSQDFTFTPQFKFVLVTNNEPALDVSDPAIWRRVTRVNFNVRFDDKDRDPQLSEKLHAELPGILNWLIAGWKRWRERGHLLVPASVQAEVAAYKEELDTIGQFLRECCTRDAAEAEVSLRTLYAAYIHWMPEREKPVSSATFARRVRQEPGIEEAKHPAKRHRVFRGVDLQDAMYEQIGEHRDEYRQTGLIGDEEGEVI